MSAGKKSEFGAATKSSALGAMPATASRGRLIGRAEAARLLDVSVATVRRMEGAALTPIVGDDGVHRFDEQTIRERARTSGSGPSPETFDGASAAEVFAMLDAGIDPAQIVVQKKLDPRAVKAIMRERAELRGGFYLSKDQAARIQAIPWLSGIFPITSGDILLRNLERSRVNPCEKCGAQPTLCFSCARTVRVTEVKRRAAMEAERAAQRDHSKRMAELERTMLGESHPREPGASLDEIFQRSSSSGARRE